MRHRSNIPIGTFLILGVFILCCCHFVGSASANSQPTWVSIPVFYIGDRKMPVEMPPMAPTQMPPEIAKVFDEYKQDPGVAQEANFQSISAGIIQVPVKCDSRQLQLLEHSGPFGWRVISDTEQRGLANSFSEQLRPPHGLHMKASFGCSNLFHPTFASFYRSTIVKPFADAIEGSVSKQGIVFIHGCCESMNDSVRKAGSLSIESGRPVLIYDWASTHDATPVHSYIHSIRALDVSEITFDAALNFLIAELDTTKLVLVAHSLGNWLLLDSLGHLSPTLNYKFAQIHLVRPDVSQAALFLRLDSITTRATSMFVYYAKNDWALWLSNRISN